MIRIILSSVVCLAVHFFSTLSHKKARFWGENVIAHEMCRFFSTTFVWNISHSKKNWASFSWLYVGLHMKYPLFLSDFNKTWIFSADFRKMFLYFMKIRSVRTKLFQTDGRTDRYDEVNNRFPQICECAEHERELWDSQYNAGLFPCKLFRWVLNTGP